MKIHLETERLVLRAITRADAEALLKLDADPEVRRYLDVPDAPGPADVQRALDRMLACAAPGRGFFAAIEKTSAEFLGWFHFRCDPDDPGTVELGYRLKRDAWGRGYATEGARALINKGLEDSSIRRVTATALAENVASRRVMEKCGLTQVEVFSYKGIPAVRYALDMGESRSTP